MAHPSPSDDRPQAAREVAAVLERIGVLAPGEPLARDPLRGGFHNDVSLARTMAGAFVLKHFVAASTNPLFPQLPHSEFAALRALRGTGTAPEPVALVEDVGGRDLLVYRFVEGSQWVSGVKSVAQLLSTVHGVAIEDGGRGSLRTLATDPARIARHAASMLGDDDEAVIRETERTLPSPEPFRPTLVHTDCGPGNLIVSAETAVLIDWQCPGIGDPVEDLANFTSPAIQILYGLVPLRDVDVDAFLAAYGAEETVARFHRLRRPYHVRLAAYCAYRRRELRDVQPETSALYSTALDAELDLLARLPC
ncbi:MAG TPA: aminoglycoside phosphotransferase family protein [Ilumatobacteraceae bacterium]